MTALQKFKVRTHRLVIPSVAGVLLVTMLGAPSATSAASPVASEPGTSVSAHVGRHSALPTLRTHAVMRRLDHPWDLAVLPDGSWFVTERDRERVLFHRAGHQTRVLANGPGGIWHTGETGLMSIVDDPNFDRNHRFYTCAGHESAGGRHDIRVLAWRLNTHRTHARIVDTLLRGIQITSGRHGGCRLRFGSEGALWVGTGDSAVGTNPQNLHSLNGKVLRLNRLTGKPWPSNPWAHAANHKRRYIHDYGHRNVQGLALRPGGSMWSVEHGTDRDDEVNRLVAGGNYGWNPVPGYDESTPMTDFSLPGRQIGARWKSGFPTIATSGAVWVRGNKWGRYEGTLAVCALKGSKLLFMKFDRHNKLVWVKSPPATRGTYGRLRSVVQSANEDLLVTTDNGGGKDRVIRVSPH
ncbi:MAG: PQQ-dependent sugar dehydrogenase [Nocardioidaceae bacterium]